MSAQSYIQAVLPLEHAASLLVAASLRQRLQHVATTLLETQACNISCLRQSLLQGLNGGVQHCLNHVNIFLVSAALMKAMTDILPDIIAIAKREPEAEAQAKAAASASVREQKAVTPMPAELRPSNSRADPRPEDRRQDRSRFFMEKGWDGFTDSGIQTKPGDWMCAECSQHNFARNQDCFKCGAPKV